MKIGYKIKDDEVRSIWWAGSETLSNVCQRLLMDPGRIALKSKKIKIPACFGQILAIDNRDIYGQFHQCFMR